MDRIEKREARRRSRARNGWRACASWRDHAALLCRLAGESRRDAGAALRAASLSRGAPHIWGQAASGMIDDAFDYLTEARRYRHMATQGGLRLP
jgi:hypothetical protein